MKLPIRNVLLIGVAVLMIGAIGCARPREPEPAAPKTPSIPAGATAFHLDADTGGYIEKRDNLFNLVISSNDPNNLKAEYEAGYVQGHLQRGELPATRDNLWDSVERLDPSATRGIPPTDVEKSQAKQILTQNWTYTVNYIQSVPQAQLRERLSRIIFRLYGIYHGATRPQPERLEFDGSWMPTIDTFSQNELELGYETPSVTFMDVYFINALPDLMDAMDNFAPRSKCSAFIKRTPQEIFLAHNSWFSFLNQSMASTYKINDTFVTVNAIYPGNILSNTDFGYNKHGIMFNETTLLATHTEAKVDALWMFLRGALAEQFAASLDEFYELVSLEASGTYMNGYGIANLDTREIGLVEMSYKSFVYYKSDGSGGYTTKTKPEGLSTAYDTQLIQPDVIIGVNFPASLLIREEIKSIENRPMRRQQFLEFMGTVTDTAAARSLITYTAPDEPLSIYGRWDLGFGTTPTPKTIPEGSLDAKVVSSTEAKAALSLKGELGAEKERPLFWMKYGTPVFDGKPFIWSQSRWPSQKLRQVPDVVTGEWEHIGAALR